MRITSGLAAPLALNTLSGLADAAAPRPDTARRLSKDRRVIAIFGMFLCRAVKIESRVLKIRGAPGAAEGMFLALVIDCAHMHRGWQCLRGNA
jgi:hypothetical protein